MNPNRNPITISRGDTILAHHTTDDPRSSYNQAIWVVEDSNPDPGPAQWQQIGGLSMTIDVIGYRDGWLLAYRPDDVVIGIIWSGGNYYAECLVDDRDAGYSRGDFSARQIPAGAHIRGTIQFPGSPLGAIVSGIESIPGLAAIADRLLTCRRCGHRWLPRIASRPGQCPRCGSSAWDRPRTGKEPGRKPKKL